MATGAANRAPDFGPSKIHPTAGAVAIGARPFLVAYNVYLGPASNLQVAKNVAKAVRGSSGGLRYVKGLGLEVDGQAQVSMNLVDTEKTPLYRAYEAVKMEAEAQGVSPTWSEIVGVVPERALFETAARHIQLRDFKPEIVLEHKVRAAVQGGESVSGFVASVASSAPTPGGGSVVAHAGALAAALAQMVAGLTAGRKKYVAVDAEMRALGLEAAGLVNTLSALVVKDADAYGAVSAAYKLPSEPADALAKRKRAIDDALIGAAEVPLETARACAKVAELAATCATKGNTNAVSDAGRRRAPRRRCLSRRRVQRPHQRRVARRQDHAAQVWPPRQVNCSRRLALWLIRQPRPSRPRSADFTYALQLQTATANCNYLTQKDAEDAQRRRGNGTGTFFGTTSGCHAVASRGRLPKVLVVVWPCSAKSADSAKSLQYQIVDLASPQRRSHAKRNDDSSDACHRQGDRPRR